MDIVKKRNRPEFNVFLIQIMVVTVLIVVLTVIKFTGGQLYTELKNWYILNLGGDTAISEVMEEPPKKETKENTGELTVLNDIPNLPDIPAGDTNVILTEVNTEITPQITLTVKTTTLLMPVNNAVISSEFGSRNNPITHNAETHKGVDLSAEKGSDIFAAESGTVVLSQKSATYGNYMIIDHGDGLKTLYAHCNKLYKSVGDTVKRGEVIAAVGSTGQSTGPHLHFEVTKEGKYINPLSLV